MGFVILCDLLCVCVLRCVWLLVFGFPFRGRVGCGTFIIVILFNT